jgi:tRNA G46 methylase TrmB
LVIATDHLDYAEWIWEVLQNQNHFTLPMANFSDYQREPKDWVKTNYQLKAECLGITPYFFVTMKGN